MDRAVISAHIVGLLRARTYMFAALFAIVLFAANLSVQSSFISLGALPQTLAIFAPLALAAMASAPSIMSGGIDFSVGPVMSLTNVMLVVVLLPHGLGSPGVSIPILVALGAFCGASYGALSMFLRVPALITGLCAFFVLTGINQKILLVPERAQDNWTDHLDGNIGPVPGALFTLAVPLLVWTLLRHTPFVRAMLSVGGDTPTAFSAGMNVRAIQLIAYALGGAFAAIGGLALTGLIHSADSSLGVQYSLIAIAAVSLGGTPIHGGRGGLSGALLGAVCIFLVVNLLSSLNVPANWFNIFYGGVLLLGVIVGAQLTPKRLERPAR